MTKTSSTWTSLAASPSNGNYQLWQSMESFSQSKILVCVQSLITRLCPLHVHKHGFIKHNRFITRNRWSVVHYDISLQRTSLQGYIVCFARYCCKEVSLERYLEEILRRLYRYLADLSYPWDVSLIICNKSREIRTNAFFVDYRLHYFCTVL